MLRDTDFLISKAKAMGMTPKQYRSSRERLDVLAAYIKNGEDARTIRDFADAVVKETGEEVNQQLLTAPAPNLHVLRGYLRGAMLFQKKVEAVIQKGEEKRQKLEEIKKAQKGE